MTTNTLPSNVAATASTQRVRYAQLWWVGLLAIGLSIVANLIVYAVGKPLVEAPAEFIPMNGPAPTIVFTTVGVLAAVIVFAIVGRFTRRPARVYTIIATVALLLSCVPNVMLLVDPASSPFPGANLGNVLVLILQHVVAAVVAVWVLNTYGTENVTEAR